ncbi:MAG: peptidyl-prolyl cis-trans isomerase, partial [Trueperaceae bacterium]
MKLSRRTNTIILWIVSLGLMAGMVMIFTPSLGGHGGGAARDTSPPMLSVGGTTLTERDLSQARQGQPMFSTVREGPVADDLDLLLIDSLIRQQVVNQVASRQRASGGAVREELEAFRVRNGVDGSRNDQAYLRLIGGAGYTDQTFRDYLRQQLQVQAWQDEVTEGVDVSDAEIETYHRVNREAYRSEPRVMARQIVTDEREAAEALRDRALAGESAADLAREASVVGADTGGAEGGDEPRPVGRPAFPSSVGDAVFQLSTPGLTPVVEAAGRFYVVEVLERISAETRPLDDVREQVRDDALAAKRQAELDARIEELRAEAEIEVLAPDLIDVDDPVVARVGDETIH